MITALIFLFMALLTYFLLRRFWYVLMWAPDGIQTLFTLMLINVIVMDVICVLGTCIHHGIFYSNTFWNITTTALVVCVLSACLWFICYICTGKIGHYFRPLNGKLFEYTALYDSFGKDDIQPYLIAKLHVESIYHFYLKGDYRQMKNAYYWLAYLLRESEESELELTRDVLTQVFYCLDIDEIPMGFYTTLLACAGVTDKELVNNYKDPRLFRRYHAGSKQTAQETHTAINRVTHLRDRSHYIDVYCGYKSKKKKK